MRTAFLPFHIPSIDEAEIQEVVDTLRSGWLTTGPRVQQFERNFGAYVGAPHAVALNSCTAALHLALAAIGLKAGDEVLVPTNTFTATAEVVVYFGARPVLVDCDRNTCNINVDALAERITPRSRAIIPVHMAGQPCDLDPIRELARQHNLAVIEDAAHALPAYYKGQMVGNISDITCFSFYATKTITTGEGGMATTANPDYAQRIRMLSLHGISKDAWKRYTAEGSWFYEVVDAGFKYNLTDIAAALGIQQLRKATRFQQERELIARRYTAAFSQSDLFETPYVAPYARHAWHLYILKLSLERLTITRAQFIEELKRRNIGSSVHFIPLHLHPYYRDALGCRPGDFPDAEWVYQRCVSLPIFPGMTDRDADDVIEAVTDIASKSCR